jgi:Immunity protein 27
VTSLKDTSELVGSWTLVGKQMVEDETSLLIRELIQKRLQKIAVDSSGWETLYQDPQDERFWELSFPHGEMQGGGPMTLRVLSDDSARLKYGLLRNDV